MFARLSRFEINEWETNPYKPPEATLVVEQRVRFPPSFDKFAFVAWPIVLASNTIFLTFAFKSIFDVYGRTGAGLAALAFLLAGWLLCWFRPMEARKLFLGGIVLAFTQFAPVLHTVFGLIALMAAVKLKLAEPTDYGVTSALGGFLIVLAVGAALISFAALVGALVGLFFPEKWLRYKCPKGASVAAGFDHYV